MSENTRIKAHMHARIRRAVASRRVFPYLAGGTAALAVGVGFLVTIVDRRDFPTFGGGIWWALVTLATVGYGDNVPHTAWGRVLGHNRCGVTFISFLTATVTSLFVSAAQEDQAEKSGRARAADDQATQAPLRHLAARLEAIEGKLDALTRNPYRGPPPRVGTPPPDAGSPPRGDVCSRLA